MTNKMKDRCEVCGAQLIYATQTESCVELSCYFCDQTDLVNIYCPDGHYICNKCHSKGALEVIREFSEKTELKDPFEIADIIMSHPQFKIYGPEHHILVPVAILTALKNNGIKKPNGQKITHNDIEEAIRRASKIPGGWCGFYGSCGAGMGSGVAISIFTGATPASDKERTQANKMTARSLSKIADGLEHCCKRSVRISIVEALDFLREEFNIILKYTPQKCRFSALNDKCERDNCLIY